VGTLNPVAIDIDLTENEDESKPKFPRNFILRFDQIITQ
jgi:hypothetical protein